MKKRACLGAILGIVCAALSAPAAAQNFLQNPHFDGTLDPWTPFDATFDADHSATADGTGSAFVSVPDSNGIGNFALVLQQCVTGIVPGATYSFGGTMRIPFDQAAAGNGLVVAEWHTASDCSDSPLPSPATDPLSNPPGPTDTWVPLARTSAAPAGAIAANLIVLVANDGPLPLSAPTLRREASVVNFNISVDDLFLVPPSVVPPGDPTLGGAGMAVLLVSLAGAALYCLRR
jgi:hypothetical protein